MRRPILVVAVFAFASAAACQAILGLDEGMPRLPDASVPTDAPDGPLDAGADVAEVTYHRLDDPSLWSSFDLSKLGVVLNGGYAGGAFDGRYVYLTPFQNGTSGPVVRYDITATFGDPTSWSRMDLLPLNGNGAGYFGGTFAKGSIYFAPYLRQYDAASYAFNGTVAAFDTTQALDASAAWSFFDTRSAPGAPAGFIGSGFDGRFVYFAPHYDNPGYSGQVARYDSQAGFDASTSWTTFDVSTVNGNARGFVGTVFDGRFLYLVPNMRAPGQSNGMTARFDTQGIFISSASWQTFDISGLNVNARGFWGGVFDGKYVYYVPSINDLNAAIVARFDAESGSFEDAGSWSLFSLASVSPNTKGFFGGAFDGRYVYFVPNAQGASGWITRYDTHAPFLEATSWSTYNLTALDGGSAGFRGAVFDGRHLYLVPMYGSVVMRFDARQPAAMPAGSTGSFL